MMEFPRLIYAGPSSHEAIVKRCESADDFAVAQTQGWRLHRQMDTNQEIEPTPDQNDPAPLEADPRPEDTEPKTSSRTRGKGRH